MNGKMEKMSSYNLYQKSYTCLLTINKKVWLIIIEWVLLVSYTFMYKRYMKIENIISPTLKFNVNKEKLKLLIIALSIPDNPRQTLAYNYSHKHINEKITHKAMFITSRGMNNNNYSIVEPHEDLMQLTYINGKKDANRDRAAKRISACKYFY